MSMCWRCFFYAAKLECIPNNPMAYFMHKHKAKHCRHIIIIICTADWWNGKRKRIKTKNWRVKTEMGITEFGYIHAQLAATAAAAHTQYPQPSSLLLFFLSISISQVSRHAVGKKVNDEDFLVLRKHVRIGNEKTISSIARFSSFCLLYSLASVSLFFINHAQAFLLCGNEHCVLFSFFALFWPSVRRTRHDTK